MARNPLSALGRYVGLLGLQLRMSLVTGMQYRWDFLMDGLVAAVFVVLTLIPLWVLRSAQSSIEGWSFPEMVIVVGWFTVLKSLLDGAVNPSLLTAVEKIRHGTLDFVLLKPADAQFLISTSRFDPWRAIDMAVGVLVLGYGLVSLGRWPTVTQVLAALTLFACAALVLYSTWILAVSAAFWVVRLDNLVFLFMSFFDFARWPVTVFHGFLRFFFTFIIPIALMTTYPSLALLGKLSLEAGVAAVGGSMLFAAMARILWLKALGRYTSASS